MNAYIFLGSILSGDQQFNGKKCALSETNDLISNDLLV